MAAALCVLLVVASSSSRPNAAPSPSSTAADPLAAAIAEVMNSYTTLANVRAIIVDVNGCPRFERYYSSSAAESRSIYSVTKSVTSTLVGIAILLFNVLAMVAEFEADLIRSRTRQGMRVAKAKGHPRGKQPKLNPRQEAHLVELLRSGE